MKNFFLFILTFLASEIALAVCESAPMLAVKVVVLSDSSGQTNSEVTKTYVQTGLDQASQSINCAANLVVTEYSKINDNAYGAYNTCDAYYWGKSKQSKKGYLTIVVPYPNHFFIDGYGVAYYGCTINGNQVQNPTTGLTMSDPNRIGGDVLYELGHNFNGAPPLSASGAKTYAANLKSLRPSIVTSSSYTAAQGGSGNNVCWKPSCQAGYGTPGSCPSGTTDAGVQKSCGNPLTPNGNFVLQTFYNINHWGCPSGYVLGASVRTCNVVR